MPDASQLESRSAPAGDARRILYFEHASALGGSCVSLLALLRELDPSRFRPQVLLARPSRDVKRFYLEAGIDTIDWPGIVTFEHTTAEWSRVDRPPTWPAGLRTAVGWRHAERRTLQAVHDLRPALVHLNSAVLYPSARALHRARFPFVWHVREMPSAGHLGVRHRFQRRALTSWPAERIFISSVERQAWVGAGPGRVIHEPLDTTRFDPSIDGRPLRSALGLAEDARVILYVGGISAIKGILPLLEALARVRRSEPRAVCLMPGSDASPPSSTAYRLAASIMPVVGSGTLTQKVKWIIRRLALGEALLRLPFSTEMERLFAASDVVVFPSLADHFARPVIEAGLMAKPIVASRFPMIEEEVRDGETGSLVPPGDPGALATAILETLANPDRAARMARASRERMLERFDSARNARAVMQVYDEVIAERSAGGGVTWK